MRQYIKQHKEILVIAIALLSAMIFQYLRISSLDIAFLFEIEAPTFAIYSVALLIVPLIVLFFVFVPILLVTEVTYNITLPKQFSIKLNEVIYSIKSTTRDYINRPNRTTVLRC